MAIKNLSRKRTVAFACDSESERPSVEYDHALVWVVESKKLYWSENGADTEITGGGGLEDGDIDGGAPDSTYLPDEDIDCGGP